MGQANGGDSHVRTRVFLELSFNGRRGMLGHVFDLKRDQNNTISDIIVIDLGRIWIRRMEVD